MNFKNGLTTSMENMERLKPHVASTRPFGNHLLHIQTAKVMQEQVKHSKEEKELCTAKCIKFCDGRVSRSESGVAFDIVDTIVFRMPRTPNAEEQQKHCSIAKEWQGELGKANKGT